MANIQYTIRNIPPEVDRVIRKRASRTGKSFNQTVVDLLTLQTFGSATIKNEASFEWLFGKGKDLLDESFDAAISDLSKIDKKLW